MSETVLPRVVYIVQTDESVRQGLARLVDSAGLTAASCASVEAFLGESPGPDAACAVLDISGLRDCPTAIRSRLRGMAATVPLIAVATLADPALRQVAREIGAEAFFHQPVDGAALLDSIDWVTHHEDNRHRP